MLFWFDMQRAGQNHLQAYTITAKPKIILIRTENIIAIALISKYKA